MKRNITAVALAVVFILALAGPAFAQDMSHTATYEMDGAIDFEKQAGHLCNTGAEYKQTIHGTGEMSKVQNVSMSEGIISMEDANDFVAGESDLVVTSVIELCAPPKYEGTVTDWVYGDDVGWQALDVGTYIPTAFAVEDGLTAETVLSQLLALETDPDQQAELLAMTEAQLLAYAAAEGEDELTTRTYRPISTQLWAVQVAADPGYSGNLHQDFTAAYGPQEETADGWWVTDAGTVAVGDDYVGNFFDVEQMARTSMGTVQRFIDISSPWSHAYLMEDMSVVGASEIEEAFGMTNIGPGDEVVGLWYDLF